MTLYFSPDLRHSYGLRMLSMPGKVVVMQRPNESEVSGFRHGNDPPEQVQASSPSQRKQPAPPTQFLNRLFQLQSFLFAFGYIREQGKSQTLTRRCVQHEAMEAYDAQTYSARCTSRVFTFLGPIGFCHQLFWLGVARLECHEDDGY
jgi:hypothetical protein